MSLLDIAITVPLPGFTISVTQQLPLAGITAVFGPSGAGKSTLLRALAGLERRARGHIRFDDENWLDSTAGRWVSPHQRGIGYVFQDAQLLPFLSVRGNLEYAARRARRHPGTVSMSEVIAAFDLERLLEHSADQLSGGERQRVAIARAVLTRPRLLLMDEPLSANDIQRKAELLPYIRQLPDTFGVPVIYVSHSTDEVAYLADHLLVMREGTGAAFGAAAAILERLEPDSAADRFAAGAILEALVIAYDEEYRLSRIQIGEAVLTLPTAKLPPGTLLRLRIRARDVALARRRPQEISIRNVLEGVVAELREDHETAYAEVAVDIGAAKINARITRAAVAELRLGAGDPVFVLIKSVSVDDPIPL